MPRKARKNAKRKDELPVVIRRREVNHTRQLEKLENWFGSDDFSMNAATRIGVSRSILLDLIEFGFIGMFEGRCRINTRIRNLSTVREIPVSYLRHDSSLAKKTRRKKSEKVIRSKAFREASQKFFEEPNPPSPYKRFKGQESMHYVKRFRWQRSVYLTLTDRYGNLSAYLRYLVYKDLGMEEEAELELARMKPRV